MRKSLLILFVCALGACFVSRGVKLPPAIPPVQGDPSPLFALRYIDIAAGTGAPMEPRKCVFVHYTGWLTNGTKFDSSRDTMANGTPRSPIGFRQGARTVIAGWDMGFEGMKVGGRRRLFIPYQLGYGETGRAPQIPGKSELIFDVELMAVADTLARTESAPPGGAPPAGGGRGGGGAICPTWAAVSRAR